MAEARGERPYWSAALRALREARGLTQEGWAAHLGYSRATIRRWESGDSAPDATAEQALVAFCTERNLWRTFDQGPLHGVTVTAEWLTDLLAEARLGLGVHPAPVRPVAEQPQAAPPDAEPPAGNVPFSLTTFVGRTDELAQLADLLDTARIVTLTGFGGAGKTRLAVEAARAWEARHGRAAWFVDLAALTDAALVPRTVAATLGLRDVADDELVNAMIRLLRHERTLLVLDNCEHLLPACARLGLALVQACDGLTLCATSREPLHINGEQVFAVPGLSLPSGIGQDAADLLSNSEAVHLFVTRANGVRSTFQLTDANASAVAALCRALDGQPLALELAAARVGVLAPADLIARLHGHLNLLNVPSYTTPQRHQSLMATVGWSYDLLDERERLLLDRLSVFAGGWTIAAVEQVCADDALDETTALELLDNLVSKSLVAVSEHDGALRFRLLEAIREFAEARLVAAGAATTLRARHAAWVHAFVSEPLPERQGPERAARIAAIEREVENIRAALAWQVATGDPACDGLDSAIALGPFWEAQGDNTEGLRWLLDLLAASPDASHHRRAQALLQCGRFAFWRGDYAEAVGYLEEGLSLCAELADPALGAEMRFTLAETVQFQGHHARAWALRSECLATYQNLNDQPHIAATLRELGLSAMFEGRIAEAEALCRESLALYRSLGDRHGIAQPLSALSRIAFVTNQFARAAALGDEAVAAARGGSTRQFLANVLADAALGYSGLRDVPAALVRMRESLAIVRNTGTKMTIHTGLNVIANLLYHRRDLPAAARLFGAGAHLLETMNVGYPGGYATGYERFAAALRRRMGDEAFEEHRAAGAALTLDEAINEALDA